MTPVSPGGSSRHQGWYSGFQKERVLSHMQALFRERKVVRYPNQERERMKISFHNQARRRTLNWVLKQKADLDYWITVTAYG